jgi:hypothetical protein
MQRCNAHGKVMLTSSSMALEALKEANTKAAFVAGKSPVNFYRCSHCDTYHLTSKGAIHPELKKYLEKASRHLSDIYKWEQKFR